MNQKYCTAPFSAIIAAQTSSTGITSPAEPNPKSDTKPGQRRPTADEVKNAA
jgi:hypothetical protein